LHNSVVVGGFVNTVRLKIWLRQDVKSDFTTYLTGMENRPEK